MTWYYKDGNREIGPISKEDLQALINDKKIDRQTLVRRGAMDAWAPMAQFAREESKADNRRPPDGDSPQSQPNAKLRTGGSIAASEKVVCSQCGRSFTEDRVVAYDNQIICADCKPVFVQRLKEGVGIRTSLRYAGFWIRVGAKIIDTIITAIGTWIFVIPLSMMIAASLPSDPGEITFNKSFLLLLAAQQLIGLAIPAFYDTFFVGRFGATLGKMACGLRVVSPEGERISYMRAFGRHFAGWISSIILGIGYLMAAFDDEKRALHDRICSTRVIHK